MSCFLDGAGALFGAGTESILRFRALAREAEAMASSLDCSLFAPRAILLDGVTVMLGLGISFSC